MKIATEIECPKCKGKNAKFQCDSVVTMRDTTGKLTDRVNGRCYGCLRCGVLYTVTATETFMADPRKGQPPAPPSEPAARQNAGRNGDRDIAMSPEHMR